MDRTLLYREIVRLANPSADQVIEPRDSVDAVTQQCLSIATTLRGLEDRLAEIRGSYLATAGRGQLSESQCDEIDYDVNRILQQEKVRLRKLEEYQNAQASEKATGFKRLLKDPKLEEIKRTLEMHRQRMFVYLTERLKHVTDIHVAQKKARAARLKGRKKAAAAVLQSHSLPTRASSAPRAPVAELEISDQEQQALLLENNDLLQDLQATLDQAQHAERSMKEISEIQTELANHLHTQTEMISQMIDDVFKTTDDIGGANVQLKQAKARNRRASSIIVYSSLIIAILLLVYDWLL
ncbi:Syntaxin ufe1 [Wickerhamiella sorbophila]|uniref:Syntaxin ufe1 n=1 Tax=Wickerhamiella sorbophila TaxID=45607 RepID=A0A2T0FEN8_9ASCO|nr:Syntaxin ufe1 [Wickerhamiella sorbophila]PRT53458.1 Syntaxin ufe1 [Wickerhamiella sorbophila]